MSTIQTSGRSPTEVFSSIGLGQSQAAEKSEIQKAQDQFMTLLVEQIRNQDPLNPMQNAEFTTQLAQINTVQGIERLNTTLSALAGDYEGLKSMQAASMIGKYGFVPGSDTRLGSGGAFGGFELNQPVDGVTVTIYSASGIAVKTMDLGPAEAGIASFQWDGVADNGERAVDGRYTFAVQARSGNDTFSPESLSVGMVTALKQSSSGSLLEVDGLGDYRFSDLRQII